MMIYVLAENHRHFEYWCRISGINPRDSKTVRYVLNRETLMGVDGKNCIFIFYETWRFHPNAMELKAMVEIIKKSSS